MTDKQTVSLALYFRSVPGSYLDIIATQVSEISVEQFAEARRQRLAQSEFQTYHDRTHRAPDARRIAIAHGGS